VPIYEYQCDNCGCTVEVMQKITEEPLQTCPSCKGALRRLMSLTSFHLKGSGWYATDYKTKKDTKGKSSEKGETKAEQKAEETSTT
jgi:putative FmdB family regulatory protein